LPDTYSYGKSSLRRGDAKLRLRAQLPGERRDVDGAPDEWNEWLDRRFGRHESVTEFIGLSEAQARGAAAASGIDRVRVIILDRPREHGRHYRLTTDRNATRLTVAIVDDEVIRAAYF
jgi:hypothetical protein